MRCFRLFPLLLFPLAVCHVPGPEAGPAPGPLEWPVGRFHLRGTIQYRRDTGSAQSTATEEHWADLTIGPTGEMRMESSTGLCRDPAPEEVKMGMARGQRRFQCGDASYFLQPAGSTVRAELTVSISQAVRERAGCIRWETVNNHRTCAEYGYNIRERQETRRVSMRVETEGQRDGG